MKGSITKESDLKKIEQLMSELNISQLCEIYTGDRNEGGQMHGEGRLCEVSGDQYDGEWNCNLRHGRGRQVYANGDVYVGDWSGDNRHGFGELIFADGRSYKGVWYEDSWHGKGAYMKLNETYVGDFVSGEVTGIGTRWYENNITVYHGEFKKGLRNGCGQCIDIKNDVIYDGHWIKDKRNGFGITEWRDLRRLYYGDYNDDLREGRGNYVHEYGVVDSGIFLHNMFHGAGTRNYLCCPLAIGPFADDQPGSACGWASTAVCGVPALICMAICCSCSFENMWIFALPYNKCVYDLPKNISVSSELFMEPDEVIRRDILVLAPKF
jgi:hypothetical protein